MSPRLLPPSMQVTAKCPYCGRLNTHEVKPNVPTIVTCSCMKGSYYVKKVDRVDVVRNSLWTWDGPNTEREPRSGGEL